MTHDSQPAPARPRLLRVTARDGGTAALLAWRGAWPASRIPVILVPGFGQNRFTWEVGDLSLPRWLADRGHPTYALEHRGTGLAKGWSNKLASSLDELVEGDLLAAVERVFDDCGSDRVALLGHSLGGLASLLFAASHPERTAALVGLAGGYFLARGSRALRVLALAGKALAFTGLSRRFAGSALSLGFVGAGLLALRPIFDSPSIPFPWPVWQPQAYAKEQLAVRFTCGMDRVSVGVASAVRRAFAHDHLALPEGRDQAEVLSRVRCPALFVHSATDALVPPAVGEPLPGLLRSSPDARFVVVGRPPDPPLGHCDLVVSENARRHVWPMLGEWLGGL
jgi:pimeloyl-ACP methyl ester carboxylesterase